MASRGSYCLGIIVERELSVNVGALGRLSFDPGRYVYVGSAMNGLEARVRRHLNTSRGVPKALHWHIDYLLREPEVRVEAVYTHATEERTECAIADAVSRRGQPLREFGCSDCRCESHLFKVDDWEFLSEVGMKSYPLSYF